MAVAAQADLRARKVEVKRANLVATLKENREKHLKDYEEAKAGYKTSLITKLDTAIAEARKAIESQYQKRKAEIANLTDNEISDQDEYIRLLDPVNVQMKVPKSFVKAYDTAIKMFEWEERDTIELTYAEFTCFVQDEWDWSSDFAATSRIYKAAPMAAR